MKKILSLMLIMVLLLSFSACQSGEDETTNAINVKHPTIKNIVDKRHEGGAFYMVTEFYRDDKFSYTFSDTNMDVIVYYKNGRKENAVKALKKGRITIDDFDTFNISYGKERLYSVEIIDDSFECKLKQKPQNFYMDEEYVYYFPEEKLQYIRVEYSGGLVEGLAEALRREHISISDLDSNAISYCRKPIADMDTSEYADLKYDDLEYDEKYFLEKVKAKPKNEAVVEDEEDEEQEKEYDFSDCTVTFKDGVLTFYGKGEMKSDDRYKINTVNQDELVEVVIKEGITNIPDGLFAGCENLRKITIPNTVKKIGNFAFSGCENLDSVVIPNSVIEIGVSAFDRCKRLTKIVIPKGVKSISDCAFSRCESLENVKIPDSVTEIGKRAFYECKRLKKIVIPKGVKSIGNYTFCGCEGLESLVIPDSVESIGASAFAGCKSLKNITISDRMIKIVNEHLFGGTALFNDKSNWENGVLYLGNHLMAVDENVSGDLKIKEGTVSIGEDAFVYCEKINSLTIPKSVVYIHKEAFWESGIKNVIVDENNKYYSSENGKLYDKNKTMVIG